MICERLSLSRNLVVQLFTQNYMTGTKIMLQNGDWTQNEWYPIL
ncbi:hypothetical protein LEP1GSC041_2346 [Leptospira noguchii str. 2006001870]|nr:hypothetical protein LEP1GSC041_2346 [Leptospira noguchii str. 2006001870]